MPEFLFQSFGVNGRRDGKQAAFMETTFGNKDMPVGMKSLWKLRDRLYGYERTGAAFESRTSLISQAAVVLPKPVNVSLTELYGHKLGCQGGMGGTRIRHLTGKAPA